VFVVSNRRRVVSPLVVAVALAASVALSPVAPVGARPLSQTATTLPPPALPTTTLAPASTTTTQAPLPQPEPEPPTTPVPETDTVIDAVPDPPSDLPPEGDAPPGGDGGPTGPQPRMGDESVALVLDNRLRTGDSSTVALLDALRPLTALGFSEEEAFQLGMGRFPVGGLATWSDDFHDPRYNPTPHLHQGNDIWAAFGAPVRSPADGVVTFTGEVVGGLSAYVTTADGTWYYMTHLGGFATDLSSGDTVTQGRVVGFNGDTGNASGGPPHVHFEIHPGGGAAVNPKPILDKWVADAIAAAPVLTTANPDANPRVLLATGELRRFDVPTSATSERAAKSPLLWSASVASGGAVLRLAEVEAARMAHRVDWQGQALRAQATAAERHEARERAVNLLARLTPPGLRAVLDAPST